MNDLELNAQAEGVMTYLKSKTESPRDGIAILGIALAMIYDTCMEPNSDMTFDRFVKDFADSLLETQKDKTSAGSGMVQ